MFRRKSNSSPKADKKKIKYTGHMGSLSPQMTDALEQFKVELNEAGLLRPEHSDPYLLRFLRARKFDLPKTKKMFIECQNWRVEFGVEDLVKNFVFEEKVLVKEHYPQYYHKTDKIGRPIYIERLGALDFKKLIKITTEERILQHYVVEYEKLVNIKFPACSGRVGRLIDQSFTIVDLKGVSMSMFSKQVFQFVKAASRIGQDYYPEMLGQMFIINAPMLFSGVWTMVKPLLDEKTRNKITILGSSYKEKLLEHVAAENLPVMFGGSCECPGGCQNSDLGPWSDGGPTGEIAMVSAVAEAEPGSASEHEAAPSDPAHSVAEELDEVALHEAS